MVPFGRRHLHSMACPKTLLAFPSSAFFRRSLQGLVIFLPSAGLQSQELGGVVQYFGKPHSPHFEAARRRGRGAVVG